MNIMHNLYSRYLCIANNGFVIFKHKFSVKIYIQQCVFYLYDIGLYGIIVSVSVVIAQNIKIF